jgi:hypothetical protein
MLWGPHALGRFAVAAAALLFAPGALAQVPSVPPVVSASPAAPVPSNAAPPVTGADADKSAGAAPSPAAPEAEPAVEAAAPVAVAEADESELPEPEPGKNCLNGVCADDIQVGVGYHPFEHLYLLTGVNWTWSPCNSSIYELETSTAYVFSNLVWLGAWGSVGFRAPTSRNAPPCSDLVEQMGDPREAKFDRAGGRFGVGVELGWRILGVDFGYINDGAVRELPQTGGRGWRLRAGLALSQELFTSQFACYRRSCCHPRSGNAVPCECERHPAGASLFIYYAHEHFAKDEGKTATFRDNMFGISLKVGVGL